MPAHCTTLHRVCASAAVPAPAPLPMLGAAASGRLVAGAGIALSRRRVARHWPRAGGTGATARLAPRPRARGGRGHRRHAAHLGPGRLCRGGAAPGGGLHLGHVEPHWPGAAIVTGHINRSRPTPGPDTIARLVEVRSGDRVTVVYSSGQSITFTATESRAVPKTQVPQDDSIWDSGNPEPVLRLITCDPSTPLNGGHYEGNWVVWATLA